MLKKILLFAFIITLSCFSSLVLAWGSFGARADVQQFISEVSTKYNFDKEYLTALFNNVNVQDEILKKLRRPYDVCPWFEYKEHFLTNQRIEEGVAFWKKNKKTLDRAEKTYGVPANVIVAIIGVESNYGENTGQFRVIDSLSTIAFEYPERAKYFRYELEQFLLLCREKNLDPTSIYGSYAGAIGQPQFMPSSFRRYAVDFSHRGNIDLSNNVTDIIGSVANYFKAHGWQKGRMVVVKAKLKNPNRPASLPISWKTNLTLKRLARVGIYPEKQIPKNSPVGFIKLQEREGYVNWLGLKNMYVITKYNTSLYYAMVVHQLSQEILKEYKKTA